MILWGADGREEEAEKEEEEEEEEGSWTQVVGEQTGFWEEVTCNSFRKGVLQLSLCTHTHTHTHHADFHGEGCDSVVAVVSGVGWRLG